jgi:hypothetical protein
MKGFADHRSLQFRLLLAGFLVVLLYFLLPEKLDPSRPEKISEGHYQPFACDHFTIGITPEDFSFWFSDRPHSLYTFVDAEFTINRLPVKKRASLRIRGTHAWNWDFRKPSMRLRLPENLKITNNRIVDFINPDDASMLANLLADNIANDKGLPSPRTRICTITLNGDYKGLYHQAEPINLATLNNQGFKNHSIIEGNLRNLRMWHQHDLWEIESADPQKQKEAQKALQTILESVSTPVELTRVRDLEQVVDYVFFARWSALMTAIASIHTNDFLGNLLIFDHDSGKAFPAIADSTGFGVITAMAGQHEKIDVEVPVNEFLTPLQNALFRIPQFQHKRNLELYKLLQNELAPEKLASLVEDYLKILKPLYFKEPYASALINIPLVLFSRKIPVSPQTQITDGKRLLSFMNERREFLLAELDRNETHIMVTNSFSNIENRKFRHVLIRTAGHCATLCELGNYSSDILPDLDFDGELDKVEKTFFSSLILHPGLKESVHQVPHWLLLERRYCNFILEPDYQTYVIGVEESRLEDFLQSFTRSCRNAVTGSAIEVKVDNPTDEYSALPCAKVIHPWQDLKK